MNGSVSNRYLCAVACYRCFDFICFTPPIYPFQQHSLKLMPKSPSTKPLDSFQQQTTNFACFVHDFVCKRRNVGKKYATFLTYFSMRRISIFNFCKNGLHKFHRGPPISLCFMLYAVYCNKYATNITNEKKKYVTQILVPHIIIDCMLSG